MKKILLLVIILVMCLQGVSMAQMTTGYREGYKFSESAIPINGNQEALFFNQYSSNTRTWYVIGYSFISYENMDVATSAGLDVVIDGIKYQATFAGSQVKWNEADGMSIMKRTANNAAFYYFDDKEMVNQLAQAAEVRLEVHFYGFTKEIKLTSDQLNEWKSAINK